MTNEGPRYKEIIDNLYDGVYFVDRDRVISYWNKGAERITGYQADEILGRSCHDNILNHVTAEGEYLCTGGCPLMACMNDGEVREADVFLHHADGHRLPVLVRCAPLRDEDGAIVGAVETFSSDLGLLSARHELRELRRSVQIDALTGIGNRAHLEGRLRALIKEFERRPGEAAVLVMDIDHFKQVNDTHGHEVGDRVLRMVAATLRQNLRATDVVGRWGGEEFLAILYEVNSDDDLRRVCEKLRNLVACSRLDVAGEGVSVGVSVTLSLGATLLREEDTPATIVRRADELMYQSKHAGRDRVTLGRPQPITGPRIQTANEK